MSATHKTKCARRYFATGVFLCDALGSYPASFPSAFAFAPPSVRWYTVSCVFFPSPRSRTPTFPRRRPSSIIHAANKSHHAQYRRSAGATSSLYAMSLSLFSISSRTGRIPGNARSCASGCHRMAHVTMGGEMWMKSAAVCRGECKTSALASVGTARPSGPLASAKAARNAAEDEVYGATAGRVSGNAHATSAATEAAVYAKESTWHRSNRYRRW
mmetsp:Transcript_7699/g.32099  ORF Transcript_7699/g.32099 Transcript_7699/m.32099 type:complete len:215 (-) Transcript_7699:292-936(-)